MEVSTSNYVIIDSGTILLPEKEHIDFKIEELMFRFTFSDELDKDNQGKTNITGALVQEGNSQHLAINVINYNALFATPSQMLKMGTLKGKDLFIYFSIVSLSNDNNNKTRVFHYTWYTSKDKANGTE